MSVQFNIGGVIKTPSKVQANIGGVIKDISKIQANIGGVIKDIWTSSSIDSYVKSLLHFNGTDALTTFTDVIGKTWTANGNAQIDTAQKKFGTASGLFDGTGDYIDTPDSVDFDVGSGDFTVDFWVRRNSTGLTRILGQCDNASAATSFSVGALFNASDKPVFIIGVSNSSLSTSAGATSVTNDSAWHHIAGVRYGNTLTLYLDGVAQGTLDVTGLTVNNSANKFAIGRAGEYDGNNYSGWIDEFRFSKGIARWTANFTPPTAEYS